MSSRRGREIRRVVILGHSGFIGSHLHSAFSGVAEKSEVRGLSFPEVDLTRSSCREQLVESFNEETAVVLCAAVKRQFGDSIEACKQNLAMVENLIAAITTRPVARVAFMSSAAVYGEETHNTSIRESTPVNPTSYYGIAKFTTECLLRKAFSDAGGPSLICFRPPLVYGPGDEGKTYGPAGFCASIRAGAPITLWGDGTEYREFLFIDDLCRMIRHLTLGEFEGTVNLVSGSSYCFMDVVGFLRAISSVPIQVSHRERSKKQVDNAFDATRIRSLLPPDFAFTPIEEGIRVTLDSCN